MRKILNNNNASAIPVVLFILGIVAAGALYTLLIIEVGQPTFDEYIPTGDVKTFVMGMIYGIPLFIITIGVIVVIRSGLKREVI